MGTSVDSALKAPHSEAKLIVGELVASNAGIGHMMSVAGATFQTDKVFVGVILLAGFGWALTTLIALLESRFNAWRPANSASA